MSIYFIQGKDNPAGLIKIGRTAMLPAKRLKALQVGSPVELHILGIVEGNASTEAYLHQHFEKYRHHGEWFTASPELIDFINSNTGNRIVIKLPHGINYSDVKAAIQQQPFLTHFGIGIYRNGKGMSERKRKQEFKKNQDMLFSNIQEIRLCCKWLILCKKTSKINYSIGSSYSLKHRVERYFEQYVSNGSFIAAVICLQVPYEIDGPNVYIAISKNLPPDRNNRRLDMSKGVSS